ncbi:hypothetical protein F4819DRAFT_471402 [Hypoxylon fuscum]|nr:hypothetical protein F4819DRAFT_471402 [Hypoxylon fuscum]
MAAVRETIVHQLRWAYKGNHTSIISGQFAILQTSKRYLQLCQSPHYNSPMRHFAMATTAFMASTILAAPLVHRDGCNDLHHVRLTFQGEAAGAAYDICVPVDGRVYGLGSTLSISRVTSYASAGVKCAVAGLDHSYAFLDGHETVTVGPPQAQSRVACLASNSSLPQSLGERYKAKPLRLS